MEVETLEKEFHKAKSLHMVRVVREYLTRQKREYKSPVVVSIPQILDDIQLNLEVSHEIDKLINQGEFFNKYDEAWYFLTEE